MAQEINPARIGDTIRVRASALATPDAPPGTLSSSFCNQVGQVIDIKSGLLMVRFADEMIVPFGQHEVYPLAVSYSHDDLTM